MKILLALILFLLLGLGAAPRIQGRLPFSRRFMLVGAEFLVLGWALGEHGLGFLDRPMLTALEPLLVLGLGWIGLLVGLQFEWRLLRRIPLSFYGTGIIQGLIVLVVLFFPLRWLLAGIFGPGPDTATAAFFMAAAGAESSQHILALALSERRQRPHAPVHLYRFCAELDNLIPLIALALLAGYLQQRALLPMDAPSWSMTFRSLGMGTLLGIALGLLLSLLHKGVVKPAHHLLVLLGFLALSGGVSRTLGFPPLFVNFVAGIVSVNLMGHRDDTWQLAAASERPFYTIFLVLVGAGWQLGSPWVVLLAPVFFLLRVSGKMLGLAIAGRIAMGKRLLGARAGLALSGQGGISVALVASFQFLDRGTLADSIYSVVLIGFIISALISPSLTLMGLKRGVRR